MEHSFSHKRKHLSLILLAELLAMSLWFSVSTVVPILTNEWRLSSGEQSWMTIGVQLGFASGALVSAILNLADRIPVKRLFAVCAVSGAVFNAAIAVFADSPGPAILLRFLTGATLAGVYPPGMKLIATWCREDRGLWISLLIGALTVGSALPHLLKTMPFLHGHFGASAWRSFLLVPSILTVISALIIALPAKSGPLKVMTVKFHRHYAVKAFKDRPVRLAIFGYLGHMWELYAMWTWIPLFILASYQKAGLSESFARLAGFCVVAIGGLGCVVAGLLGDRLGRTFIAIISLLISGTCVALSGLSLNSPLLLTVLGLVWGLFVISDSAQFSAAVTELSDQRYVGTALTVQTSLGFLLTIFSIRLIPWIGDRIGPEWAFLFLLPGPAFGIWSMLCLRRLPEAVKMASGNR